MRTVDSDPLAATVRVTIYRAALESIFDECDRYNHDETGGRLLGTFHGARDKGLSITVTGVIEPGPKARRSPVEFFQDGDYQENVFRTLEKQQPDIEHLGNWHTHHVNGYPTLSGGDRATYHRIVNHQNHNLDFFYALLVTARNDGDPANRYSVRHFILFRDDEKEYEIGSSNVIVVDRPVIWPLADQTKNAIPLPQAQSSSMRSAERSLPQPDQRVIDQDFFQRLQPGLRSFLSKDTGKLYWRGSITLIDDSTQEIVVAELGDNVGEPYAMAVKEGPAAASATAQKFAEMRFGSAREAVVKFERALNRELFQTKLKPRKRPARFWER
jgi:hypothetical protein